MKSNSKDAIVHTESGNGAHPLDGIVTNPTLTGPILQMQSGLWELARRRALESGATGPCEGDLRALQEHALAMARQTYRDRYDPTANPHDAMHQAEYQNKMAQREEAEKGEAHALANLRDAETKAAQTMAAGPEPTIGGWVTAAFIVAIMATVAPTAHDLFPIDDNWLAWFIALLSSVFVAAMVTFGILSGRRTKWAWISVAAGITLGMGLFLVRISAAERVSEILLAAGLTIAEIAAVLLLEALARSLVHEQDDWLGRHAAEEEAINSLEAKKADVARWQNRIKELLVAIKDDFAYVENRHLSNIGIKELESVAERAVRDGYFHGLAENIGRVRGVRAQ